jgi:hypothetical protein
MTDRILVGLGLKLEDVGSQRRIGDLDQPRIVADLRDAGVPSHQLNWLAMHPLTSFDRVLLARSEHSGQYEAIVLIRCCQSADLPFLTIEALASATAPRAEALLKRMLAFLILRFDTFVERPVAILAQTRCPSLLRVMHDVAPAFGGATFYPKPAAAVVSLAEAAFAHRLGHVLGLSGKYGQTQHLLRGDDLAPNGPVPATLDFRALDEAMLIEGARLMFRARLPGRYKAIVGKSGTPTRPVRLPARTDAVPAVLTSRRTGFGTSPSSFPG